MSTQYFVRIRPKVIGPLSINAVKELAAYGAISSGDEISSDEKTWSSADKALELNLGYENGSFPNLSSESEQTHDVFVSYSSFNAREASSILSKLEAAGIRCWIASDNIAPGIKWINAVIEGINRSRLMVLVFSEHADRSPHVHNEVIYAIKRELTIVPFRLKDVKQMGALTFSLSNVQWLNAVDPPLERHIERLVNEVRQHLDQRRASEPALGAYPSNLPPFNSEIYGREEELRYLCDNLTRERRSGIVSIHGAGGIGKTRLACEVARTLLGHYMNACYFIELKEEQSIPGICNAVALGLGSRLDRSGDPEQFVSDILRSLPRPASLLILDGFDPPVEDARRLMAEWRRKAPHVQIVATSRSYRPFGIDGETHFALGRLSESTKVESENTELTIDSPAVRLFNDIARRHNQSFAIDAESTPLVLRVCRALQGWPLAIILGASRIRYVTLEEMNRELDASRLRLDQMGGQSLQKVIDWSYELLTSAEREVFVQACIFHDGFDREAVESVLHVSNAEGSEVLRHVEKLVDLSLLECVQSGSKTRYWMFNTIQEFGRQKWAINADTRTVEKQRPPDELARRWFGYVLSYVERWNERVHKRDCMDALKRISRERENILAAHTWALESGEGQMAARLIVAYARTLELLGPWRGRVDRLNRSLDACGDADPTLLIGLLVELARAYWDQGESQDGLKYADRAVEMSAKLGDRAPYAVALWQKAELAHFCGDNEQAFGLLEQSISIFAEIADPERCSLSCSLARSRLAYIHNRYGNYPQALAIMATARQEAEHSGSLIALARCWHRLGWVHWFVGKLDEALRCVLEAERLSRQAGDQRWTLGAVINRVLVLNDQDQFDDALTCLEESMPLIERLGNNAWIALALGARGWALMARGDFANSELDLQKALKLADKDGWLEDQAFHLGNLGRLLFRTGRFDDAADYFRRAATIHRQIDKCDEYGHRRFWGNLVNLAAAEFRRGSNVADVELVVAQAVHLSRRLNLANDDAVRMIREDLELLATLQGK